MHTVTKTTCIDFHAHALPQSFRDAIAELGIDPIAEAGFPFPAWNAEAHLQFMAEAGISRALLSAIPASIRLWKSGTGENACGHSSVQGAPASGILASMGMTEAVDVRTEFEKLYFDIAGDPEPNHLAILALVADESHILYGSDYPHSPANVILVKKRHFDANERYDGKRERIYCENAVTVLERGIHGAFVDQTRQ